MHWLDRFFDALIARRIRKSARPLGWSTPKAVGCWDCNVSHILPTNLRQAIASAEDFFYKHPGHEVNWFEQPGLAGLWTPNSDFKEAYAASVAYTFTSVNSLATASTLLAGACSLAVSNTTNLYTDYQIGGKLTMGASVPTVDTTIEVHLYSSLDDTPTYPDTLLGTDAAKTLTSAYVKRSAVKLFERIFIDATANRVYSFGSNGAAQFFGFRMIKLHGLFITQNSGQSLAASGNTLTYTPQYQTVLG